MSVLAASTGGLLYLDVDDQLVYLDVVRERAQAVPDGIDRASVLGRQGWHDPDDQDLELAPQFEAMARRLLAA